MIKSSMASLFIAVLVAAGCSNQTDQSQPREKTIVGSWQLIISGGGLGGGVRIATSEPERYTKVLRDDQTITTYRNGSLISKRHFTIVRKPWGNPRDSVTLFHITDYDSLSRADSTIFVWPDEAIDLRGDTLCFRMIYASEGIYDCYKRIR